MLEATSTLPARAFRWTPLGAFRLSERVGDSSLKDDIITHPNDLAALAGPVVTVGNVEGTRTTADGSPQIFEELGPQQGDLHRMLEQGSFRT